MAEHQAPPEKTAAEEFAESIIDLESELDKVVLSTLTQDKRVPVFETLTLDDSPLPGEIASKLWNVKFSAADQLSPDAVRIYAEELPDGKRSLPDQQLFESLGRLKVTYRILRAEGQPYLVLSKEGLLVKKPMKTDVVRFQTA
jgi:hypothetical protein